MKIYTIEAKNHVDFREQVNNKEVELVNAGGRVKATQTHATALPDGTINYLAVMYYE